MNGNSLQTWQTLFKERRGWAIEVTELSVTLTNTVQKLESEIAVVQRSAAIAVENIKQHVGNLSPKFEDSKAWADSILKDQTFLLENWQPTLNKLSSITAFEELGRCLKGAHISPQGNAKKNGPKSDITLYNVVNIKDTKRASELGANISKRFGSSVLNLVKTFENVVNDSQEVIENFSQGITLSNSDSVEQSGRLMEEVEIVTKKISMDYEHVIGLQESQKAVSQVSRMALLHTRNYLPTLQRTLSEIDQLARDTAEKKDNAILSAVQYMQKISHLESTVAKIHAQLASLDTEIEDGEAFDVLNSVIRLPAIYGSLLVECVRRREWNDRITADSSSLVEEMATYKEEELRRRRKWEKDMESIDLTSIDDMALGVEVNIHAQKQSWPNVSRQDVRRFQKNLKDLGSFDDVYQDMEALVKTLDAPTKQQAKRAKAFKNGSIHDAAFGRNSLLLRGDDDLLQSLKNDKSRLEDRLRSSESRIRKLEDLLHRQSQMSRTSSNNAFGITNGPMFERHTTSPLMNHASSLSKPHEIPSRRSSVSSRRISMNNEPDEKSLNQKIISLEAELGSEKAKSAALQKNAEAQSNIENDLRIQVHEAVSIKEDLMGNLEAQQREFDGERRLLEDTTNKYQLRIEELEDEMDRMLENHDHENRIHFLEEELERVHRDSAEEVQKAQSQTDSLRNDCAMQHEKFTKLERQVHEYEDDNAELLVKIKELSSRLLESVQIQAEHHRGLRAALLQLSKDESAPEDFSSLVDLIEVVAEKTAKDLNHTRDMLEETQANNVTLDARITEQAHKIYDLTERLRTEEIEVFGVRETVVEHRNKLAVLQTELDHERNQHYELRSRFATEEEKSDSLQIQVEDGKQRISDLINEIDGCSRRIQQLDGALKERQSQIEDSRKAYNALSCHFEAHSSRAEEISMWLHSQTAALGQLLEQIGLTATKQDDKMVIQKVSRAASASTMLNDPSVTMNRSISGPLPSKGTFEISIDDSILRWAKAGDAGTEESKFNDFIQGVNSFDLGAFSEAVVRRVKEIEHTARKWQREARAYREKSHRAQSEAHEKIAFRSFKEGDLALFLPTRNQATRPWAAFNVGAPHFFLREQDSHKLRTRDWLLARISKVEERVVNLSQSINGLNHTSDRRSISEASDGGASLDDENPFELSDGLRWYLLDAAEEKPGAPINIGLSKVTVASANVDAKGSIRMKKTLDGNGATKTLTRSLDSRRNSSNSKKSVVAVTTGTPLAAAESGEIVVAEVSPNDPPPANPPPSDDLIVGTSDGRAADEVCTKDLLWGP